MNVLKYVAASLASGAVWALIAFLIGVKVIPDRELLTAMLASPVIGLIVGVIYLPAYRWPTWGRILAALFTLEFSAVLFGCAMGRDDGFGNILGVLWGLNLGGYVVVLWPLAYLNHFLLGKLLKPRAKSAESGA